MPAAGLRTDSLPLPHDLAQLRSLRGVALSADGQRVAYVVRMPRFDAKKQPSDDDPSGGWKVDQQLYVVDRAGGTPLQLTFAEAKVAAPRFSPDGRELAFMRSERGKSALWVLDLRGGEARRVDLGEYEPQGYEWAPDGRSFAFTAERPASADDKKARWQRGGARPIARELPQVHLLVAGRDGGEPRHINRGTDTVVNFAWSPDGSRFALVTATASDPYEMLAHLRLSVVGAADGAPIAELEKEPRVLGDLAWSPDGKRLAWLTASGGPSHIDELRVSALDAAAPKNLAAGLDLTMSAIAWTGNAGVLALAYDHLGTRLVRLPAAGGPPHPIATGDRVLWSIETDRAGQTLLASATTATVSPEPTLIDLRTGTVRSLARINPQTEQWKLATVERVTWKNQEGTELDGLLWVTPHAAAGAAAPLLVMPHGGPDWLSMKVFNPWAHFFAARGYSVFEPNYRGGIGYGRAFYEANRNRFGEIELMDIESGVDALIAARKADPDRLFYGSWSWGGYLSAWTLTHTTRYRAIMVGAGVVDTIVQYVTSDINHGIIADWEYRGSPWRQTDHYDRANPARYLKDARSPTLIIHGEQDERVPIVNAHILHRALVDLGVDVTFWSYPREPHGFQEPAHNQHMLEVWAAFFDSHLPR